MSPLRGVSPGSLGTPFSGHHAHLALCSQILWYEQVTDANESGEKELSEQVR